MISLIIKSSHTYSLRFLSVAWQRRCSELFPRATKVPALVLQLLLIHPNHCILIPSGNYCLSPMNIRKLYSWRHLSGVQHDLWWQFGVQICHNTAHTNLSSFSFLLLLRAHWILDMSGGPISFQLITSRTKSTTLDKTHKRGSLHIKKLKEKFVFDLILERSKSTEHWDKHLNFALFQKTHSRWENCSLLLLCWTLFFSTFTVNTSFP